ncbi:hypothetical protein LCDVSa147R [Lymphocystis disease virus 3]|uniref:Uncharacterized protein n=1 Tax=Lymphocystis disease virus 3 TaxID=2560566 RepID=A0A1B2RW65_9VIRU|nr:hypothetical protein BZK12_gp147 [Lymphocystis disease virus Sa]AOC55231.1 hypothetical protein LCDVSa147R [Lymphocystis disease virus 3]
MRYLIEYHRSILNRYDELIERYGFEASINKYLYLVEMIQAENYLSVVKKTIIKQNWFDLMMTDKPKSKKEDVKKKPYGCHSLYKFKECLKKFQGQQTCKIPDKIYEELEKKFKSYRLLISNAEGFVKYSKITKNHVLIFLKELKYSKQYENVNLIYYVLTNKKEDVSHLESVLIEDFIKLLTAYESKDEKENLDANYVLVHLLNRRCYRFEKDSFHLNKSGYKLKSHNNLCSKLFKTLNWDFTPL